MVPAQVDKLNILHEKIFFDEYKKKIAKLKIALRAPQLFHRSSKNFVFLFVHTKESNNNEFNHARSCEKRI